MRAAHIITCKEQTSVRTRFLPDAQAQPQPWDIGPNRFPFSAQKRYFNFDAFAYPAAFTAGTLGRNTFESPGMRWTQVSLSKEFRITEALRNLNCAGTSIIITKEPQLADPNAAFNTNESRQFRNFQRHSGQLLRHRHRANAPSPGRPFRILSYSGPPTLKLLPQLDSLIEEGYKLHPNPGRVSEKMKPATTVSKICRILAEFRSRPSMGVTELARRADLLPSDVHRILNSLAAYGLIEQNPTNKTYRLGMG